MVESVQENLEMPAEMNLVLVYYVQHLFKTFLTTLGVGRTAGIFIKWTGRYFYVNIATQVLTVMRTGLLIMLQLDTGAWAPFVILGLLGLGFGASWVTTIMALLSAITSEQQAVLQSARYFVRCVGMVIGFTFSFVGFQKVLKDKLEVRLAGQANTTQLIAKVRSNFDDW